ncbi:hypothetical protein [Kitasatospora purpeofusca]|uniref:hypothetical protein n=1 Tax=Kitasatospora purpeofusca TaxID=67352 RepID=UPI0036D2EC4B
MRLRIISVAAAAAVLAMVQPGTAVAAFDPSTTVTFVVTSGALTMSVPVSAALGSGAPGTQVSAPIGPVNVTDLRALLSASWTVTASSTDFANGPSTIPATSATYVPGTVTTTGTITATTTSVTLSNSPQAVVTGSSGVGDNTATWNPTVTVSLPTGAIGGIYTGTLTHSVA